MSISVWLGELVRQQLAGISDVTPEQGAAFEQHYELLLQWNSKINLTTVTELHEAALRHYCESVFLANHLTGGSVADVGSGAGFPGIPIAIMRPDWSVHLIESHQRKAVFLREACRELPNIRVLAIRAESVTDSYDWFVSRAVAPGALKKLRIARRFAVLCSQGDAEFLGPDRTVALPWGDNRVLAIGRVPVEGRST